MLTNTQLKNLKPDSKVYRISDGQVKGLSIEVRTSGSKRWRYRFKKPDGKYSMISLGEFPHISLSKARELASEKRGLLIDGVDISRNINNRFKEIFKEWYNKQSSTWTERYAASVYNRVDQNVLPYIGNIDIQDVNTSHLLSIIDRIEDRGSINTCHKVYQYIHAILSYALAKRLIMRNVAIDIKNYLKPLRRKKYPAPTDLDEVSLILKEIDLYSGSYIVKQGLLALTLSMLRPGEVRKAEWRHINFDEGVWEVPAENMKMKKPHLVPMSRQLTKVLQELYPLTGTSKYLFPSEHGKANFMSENTLNMAHRRMGFGKDIIVSHSWRSISSTLLNEAGWNKDWIEIQLAHVDSSVRGVYNRALYLDQRREMIQQWADFIDYLKSATNTKLSLDFLKQSV